MTEYGKAYRDASYVERRHRQALEDIRPYAQILSNVYAVAVPKIIIRPNGSCEMEHKLSAEAEELVSNIQKIIDIKIENFQEDVLTHGHGFLKQTRYALEHIPTRNIYSTDIA